MSNSLTAEILQALKPRPGKNVVLTVGNAFRHDDGVGPYLAAEINSFPQITLVDAGQNPENIVDDVVALKPNYIVVFDAANFNGKPGELRVIPQDLIPQNTLSTHMIPLNIILELIKHDTDCEVCFIGIQAASFELGEGLSDPVKKTADQLIEQLSKIEKNG